MSGFWKNNCPPADNCKGGGSAFVLIVVLFILLIIVGTVVF